MNYLCYVINYKTENNSLVSSTACPDNGVHFCFPYLLRFLFASRPVITGQVLGIVNRVITTHLVKKAGYSKKTARTGAVTLIQRCRGSGQG